MTANFYIGQGDLSPSLVGHCEDKAGTRQVLTGASAVIHAVKPDGTTFDRAVTISDAATGQITYDWQAGDTDAAGVLKYQIEVTYADSTNETFPNDGFNRVKINPSL